jgi:MFS family permease
MRDMADDVEPKRYTVLTVILMLLATVVALAIGYLGFGLWMTNMMSFAQDLNADPVDQAALAAFLFLSAGPVAAGAGIVLGWLSFVFFRAPRTGVKLVFFLPVTWAVAVLAYIAIVTTACDGSFTCGF